MPAVAEMIAGTVDHATLVAQFRSTVPAADRLAESRFRALAGIASGEIGAIRPQILETIGDPAVETYMLAEIEAPNASHGPPEGEAIPGRTGSFMQSRMQALGPTLQATMRTISERIRSEIMP